MTRTPKGHKAFLTAVIRFLLVGMLVFAAGRALVWAQVWSWPLGQSPINNPSQPPTTGSFTNLLKKSPSTLQVVTGSAKTAAVSSMPGFFGNPVAGATIAVIGQNSFTTFPSIPKPSGNVGVYGYAAGNGYGLFGTTPPAAVSGYGVAGDVSSVSGVAGHFLGAVTVLTNGSAKGDLTTDGRITADKGFECLEAAGCKIDDDSTAIRISNDAGAHGLFSYSAVFPGISINNTVASKHCSLNVYVTCTSDAQCTGANGTTCIHDGKSLLAFAKDNIGLSGYGATGGISIATQGGDDAYTYRALVGSAVVPNTPTDSFSGRIGVQGMTTGGVGNAVSYTSSPPNYDLAAGIRACVKDAAGTIVNKYGAQADAGIWAGYFYGPQQCTGSITTVIDSTWQAGGHYNSIAIGLDGNPVVAYNDYNTDDLKIAKCGKPDCSDTTGPPPPGGTGNIMTVVDTTNALAGPKTILVPADGLPVISYHDPTATSLKVLKCGKPDCSDTTGTPYPGGTGNRITVVANDGANGDGFALDMAIDPLIGFPVISYFGGRDDLKMARCNDAACSSSTLVPIKTGGDPGRGNSIAFTATSSRPIISFDDGDLGVVYCGNSTCNSGNVFSTIDLGSGNLFGFAGSNIKISPVDNDPIILYAVLVTGTHELRVTKCKTKACNGTGTVANITTTIDPNTNDFEVIDMAMPADNKPVIVTEEQYSIPNGGALDIIKCTTYACDLCANDACRVRRSDIYNTMDESVAISTDGFPIIAHSQYHSTDLNVSRDMRVTKCADAGCTQGLSSCVAPQGNVMIAGNGAVNPTKGAVLKIGNTYLTKCNLIGMLRKAGQTQFPACS